MADPRKAFAQAVMTQYRRQANPRLREAAKSLSGTSDTADSGFVPLGHPEFQDLRLGESGHCDLATAFIDLRKFTRRTYLSDDPAKLVFLANAFLTQCAQIVQDRGGHVLGFRGDGLFAGFGGPGGNAEVQVRCAVDACVFALDATNNVLNAMLVADGEDRIQVRAGVDFGRADFVRSGTAQGSEVNVVGFAANSSSKAQTKAKSWELVIGRDAAGVLGEAYLLPDKAEPAVYEDDGVRNEYEYYKVNTSMFLEEAAALPEQLNGRDSSQIKSTLHLRPLFGGDGTTEPRGVDSRGRVITVREVTGPPAIFPVERHEFHSTGWKERRG